MKGTKSLEGFDNNAQKRLAAAVFSSCLLVSCLHSGRPPEIPRSEVRPQRLESEWSRGSCSFSGNSVQYTDFLHGQRNYVTLDVHVSNPSRLLCSENFTVIVTPQNAVLSLGGEGVLSGAPSLGCVGSSLPYCEGGRYLAVNSIQVSLATISREDGAFSVESLSGDQLTIRSGRGRLWSITLSDPFGGWSIY